MKKSLDENKPIYLQIKEQIEDWIINGTLTARQRVPSTNELAAYYKINPATAAKGINELVTDDVLFKRRGVGMFVSDSAKVILVKKRKKTFYDNFMLPLKMEAKKLQISEEELVDMVKGEGMTDEN